MNRRGFLKMLSAAPVVATAPQAVGNSLAEKILPFSAPLAEVHAMAGVNLAAGAGCMAVSTAGLVPQFMSVALELLRQDRNARLRWRVAYRSYRRRLARDRIQPMSPRAIMAEFDPWYGAHERKMRAKQERKEANFSRSSWEQRYTQDRKREYSQAPDWCKDEGLHVEHMAYQAQQKMMEGLRDVVGGRKYASDSVS